MKRINLWLGIVVCLALLCAWDINTYAAGHESTESTNAEWHQWRGQNRDGISHETGILKSWPEAGPKELWRVPLGKGFSGISVSNGRVYTMYAKGEDEIVVCLDAETGAELWRHLDDYLFENRQGGDGPRSTPTVDGDTVYVLSAFGRLVALDANSGKQLWDSDFSKAFSSRLPQHGFSSSPIVAGALLLIETGGVDGKAIVAFDKKSGEIVWSTQNDPSGYSSPITVEIGGTQQAVFFTGDGLVAVAPKDGTVYWRHPWQTSYNVNAATPIFISPDRFFISSGYDVGATVVQIEETDGKLTAKEVWKSRVMQNHFATSVLHEGYIYGFDQAFLKCINANTGEEAWSARGFNKGTLILADGHLIVLGERGNLALVEATSEEYRKIAETQVLSGRCWTAPSLSGGKLYLRSSQEMVCLDFSE